MAVNRSGPAISKRSALVCCLFCMVLVAGLIAWNLSSSPSLPPVRGVGKVYAYQADYSGTGKNGGGRQPETLLPQGAQNRSSGQPTSPSMPIKVVTPTPVPVLTANLAMLDSSNPLPPSIAYRGGLPELPPTEPQYQNLLVGLNNPASAVSVPARSLAPNKLAPGVSYSNSLDGQDLLGPAIGKIQARGGELVDSKGSRFFVAGINYEGHTDRAWLMWQNDKWDPNLINQNFAVAAAGGFNAVRIFVQTQLRDDIKANNWTKFDTIVQLAQQNGLRLLVTFSDYYEPDLRKLIEIDNAVAHHFANNGTILAYDLRNEPQFGEFIGAIYPDGQQPAMQNEDLIHLYGERVSQAESDGYRNGAGRNIVPGYMNSRQAYIFANMMRYHEELLSDLGTWVNRNGRVTALDFFNTAEAVKWQPFTGALNATVQRYIDVRQNVILSADPGRLVTVGYNRPDLAYMPANRALGFISYHNFPGDQAGGLAQTLAILNFLKNYYSAKPVVMEEFGYSNSDGRNEVPLMRTASYETSVWLFLYGRGYAGGFKWMLNNFTIGANPYENNFGLLDNNSQPKPAYFAERAVMQMAANNRTPSGDFGRLETYDGVTISYSWGSNNAFFGNGKEFKDDRVQINQQDAGPWAIWWPNNGLGNVSLSLSNPGQVLVDMRAIFPSWKAGMKPSLNQDNGGGVGFEQRNDSQIAFQAQPGVLYTLKAPVQPAAFQRAQALNVANNTYFQETGHNLSNFFKRYWESKGGLSIYGFPVSEEFQENGLTVQYFERARFEYHPENGGTPNEVQLGLLGNLLTGGRKEAGEPPFQNALPQPNSDGNNFFTQTQHNMRGGFKTYWEQHGGLAQFGYPITEEFQETNPVDGKVYTVQYFERNRFEWHPEFKGTPAEFQLGLLGLQVIKARGWLN